MGFFYSGGNHAIGIRNIIHSGKFCGRGAGDEIIKVDGNHISVNNCCFLDRCTTNREFFGRRKKGESTVDAEGPTTIAGAVTGFLMIIFDIPNNGKIFCFGISINDIDNISVIIFYFFSKNV